jgi:hypothetical protein
MVSVFFLGVHLTIIFLLSFWMWKKQTLRVRLYFWPALVMKLAAGIGLGLLYKYHYSVGDTFRFFDDASVLTKIFWEDPVSYFNILISSDDSGSIVTLLGSIQQRSLFLVKIVSGVNIITGNNYWLTSLYFSLVSFVSAFLLFEKVTTTFSGSKLAAAIAFLFFPSIVFWSSGIIKESLAMAGICMLSRIYISILANTKPAWWEWILTILSVVLVWNLKYYWTAVFIPVAITTIFVYTATRNFNLKARYKIVIWMILFLIICFGVTLVHPNFYLENFLQVLVQNYNEFIRISPSENVIHYQLTATWASVVFNSPLALLSGFFRPFIWEATNLLQVMVAVENLLVLVLCVTSVMSLHTICNSPYRLLIFSTLVYIVILCLFLALSTPNLGTLTRYKVGFQPFFVFMLLVDNVLFIRLRSKLGRVFPSLV